MADRIGGSFAPPLTDELLSSYKSLIDGLDPRSQVRDAMQSLYDCCTAWWNLPESTGDGRPHPSGRGIIIHLDKAVAEALWDAIPWDDELAVIAMLFDGIDATKDRALRNAAFHLLWHVKELARDREPMTADKL